MGWRLPRDSEGLPNPKVSLMTPRTGVPSSETVSANGYCSPRKGWGMGMGVQRSREKEVRSWGHMFTRGLGYQSRCHLLGHSLGRGISRRYSE